MATLALGAAGSAVGGQIGGTVLGVSAATLGGAIGASLGSVVDSMILNAMQPGQRIEGQRLESAQVTTASEGAVLPRVHGRTRIGGNIIWATDFEEVITEDQQGGGKGGGPSVTTTSYSYFASFAVAICEGPITGIGRIWADGDLMDLEGVTWRLHKGGEGQSVDPFIAAKMGVDATPAYRGVAYVVFEALALENFGNRIPQLSFEVFRPLAKNDTAEGMLKAITMIPASGEYTYATDRITKDLGQAVTAAENVNANRARCDFLEALDRLQASAPNVESVSLVVSWFGDDLQAGECLIRPGVEVAAKNASVDWKVNGVERGDAYVVSKDDEGRPIYGGTPADFSIIQAIQEIKDRGLRVTFYPFILMDVPASNSLPDPYSDNAASSGQPAFPWRGRITCSPAPGYAGSPDHTASVATQISAFFGSATVGDFDVDGETVSWSGAPGDRGFRRFILHYAHLCAAAGGVDAFLIGSEMRGLTWTRGAGANYPAVGALVDLAGDVRSILGAGAKISYAADWSEYFGHQPADGSGDVFFHLDPLWADPQIDFIGIDNYMPLSDWRDGFEHADAADWGAIYQQGYLKGNIEAGEGFDWYYASAADRADQLRSAITDGGTGKPWVFRYKDLANWWANDHYNRPGGVESGTPTAWTPESKPIRFTEFGCPAIDRGTNQPNVFFDPKSSESFYPYFSRGWRDDAIQREYLEAMLAHWGDPANNPASGVYAGRMIDMDEAAAWTWDARPYPFFPALDDVWSDGDNWRLGHWLSGRLGSAPLDALVRELCLSAGLPASRFDASGLWGAVEGYAVTALESPRASITALAAHFGFDAVETGGRIVFRMRGFGPAASVALDDLVEDGGGAGEPIEIERAQETEIPQALKWTFASSDAEYESAQAEARRITVAAARVSAQSFAFAVPPEEAERRVRRALQEIWVGRETARFSLPPSMLALDPGDVLTIGHDGRNYDFRLLTTAEAEGRAITGMRHDRLTAGAFDLPSGAQRPPRLRGPSVFGPPSIAFLDLPRLPGIDSDFQPLIAADAKPWPGYMAVWRSQTEDGFRRLTAFGAPAQMGVTAAPFAAGSLSRFDNANALLIDIDGAISSVSDLELFDGANAFAVESPNGGWEIIQAGAAELVAAGRYRLTRLLRGQRGTEGEMAASVGAGARVVALNSSLALLPIAEADVDIPWNWRVGPASLPITDAAYRAESFTPRGRGRRPFSPAHIRQPWRQGRTPGDLTISWIRRSRSLAADNWTSGDAALAEESEAYEVEILDGLTVLRTLSSATPSAIYTAAQQTADRGGTLGPGDTLDIRVFQISAIYGRGAPTEAALQF